MARDQWLEFSGPAMLAGRTGSGLSLGGLLSDFDVSSESCPTDQNWRSDGPCEPEAGVVRSNVPSLYFWETPDLLGVSGGFSRSESFH